MTLNPTFITEMNQARASAQLISNTKSYCSKIITSKEYLQNVSSDGEFVPLEGSAVFKKDHDFHFLGNWGLNCIFVF